MFPDDVITADGFVRSVITINGMFPGPTLEVMEGVQVSVVIYNAVRLLQTLWFRIGILE
jgi:hypothetical protein